MSDPSILDHPMVAWLTGLWGAGVAYARSRTQENPWGWGSFALHLATNCFVVWLAWVACQEQGMAPNVAVIISGVAGWLGVETMRFFEPTIQQLAGSIVKKPS